MNLLLLLAVGCSPSAPIDSGAPADDVVDMRLTADDAPIQGDDQVLWWGPDVVIEPGEDKMFCIFGTYTGEDAGIHALETFQGEYGHHLLLMGTTASALDFPDGAVADCSAEGDLSMADLEPLVLPTATFVAGEEQDLGIDLGEGMAVKIDEGQRWVLQAHYINSTTEPFRVQDPARVTFLAEDEVETWAAPFVLNADDFTLPPGEETSITFDCPVEDEWQLLYVTGHMHEWGTAFRTEHVVDGQASTLYDIPAWDPAWRDAPPVERFGAEGHPLRTGESLRTTCTWFNDEDTELAFPHEMCATVMVVYPQTTAVICDGD